MYTKTKITNLGIQGHIQVNCEVLNGTGKLPITAFTTDAEKIFRMLAPDIFRMKHSEDVATFETVKNLLQTSPNSIEIGPNKTLSMNNVLQCVLNKVVAVSDEPQKSTTEEIISQVTENASTESIVAPTTEQQIVPSTTVAVPNNNDPTKTTNEQLSVAEQQQDPVQNTTHVLRQTDA